MSMKEPLVSVIIPNFNYHRFVGKCIESVTAQDYKNIEIIVVDDGSTDKSVEFILGLNTTLRLIQQDNQGVSAARNRGIFEAKGDYIAFLDSDDYWESSKISKQVEAMEKSDADLVYSGINLVSPDGMSITGVLRPEFKGDCSIHFRKFPARAIILLGCSNALVKKSFISKSGLFDVSLSISADWDFFRRYCDIGHVVYIQEPLTFYRQHSGNMSTYSNSFISDTLRCVWKMTLDTGKSEKIIEKLATLARTYLLVVKYFFKSHLQSKQGF